MRAMSARDAYIMLFRLREIFVVATMIASATAYGGSLPTESAASPGQINYAEEQNYDDTGPGSKGAENAYSVYSNPDDAQLGYSDYSSFNPDDGFTPSPLGQTTPRFWTQLSEQEYQSQNSFVPISNSLQSPIPKFYTNSQPSQENQNVPAYYKMRPNIPFTSVVPYQLDRQPNSQGSFGSQQAYSYQRSPYLAASNYRQSSINNGRQFGISPSSIFGLKEQQQEYQRNRGSYASAQPYQRHNSISYLQRQHRFGIRQPNTYLGNQISRTYRLALPRYSGFE